MRGIRSAGTALLFALSLALPCGGARADDPVGGAGGGAAACESALELALGALRAGVQAKLKEAELLEKLGRLEEALAAVRDVARLYQEGMADVRALLGNGPARVGPTAPGQPPEQPREPRADEEPPAEDEPLIGPEPGVPAFGGRKGKSGKVAPGGIVTPARTADDAVLSGLRWLAAHQSPDGGWSAVGFGQYCDGKANAGERPDGPGKPMYDVGVTGLSLCAFLGAGFTNRGDHEFASVVRRGLAYLRNRQDPEGCFGPRETQHYFYNHAMAALAMVEAYGMTVSPLFKASAQRGLDFLSLARNPYFAWRYGVKPGDNDTSCTMAAMMVFQSARLINKEAQLNGRPPPLVVEEEAFAGARQWAEKMTDPDYGRVGYVTRGSGPARPQELVDRFPGEKSESMTACGMLLRIFTGEDPAKSSLIRKGADLLRKLPPAWNTNDGSIDMYYWYYGALAMFQVGGEGWRAWERGVLEAIVRNQRQDGAACGSKGSWDPVDPWGSDGGRVYSTALMTLTCEIWYRYDRVFGTK